ncbi:MAG: DUF4065 domain-containing protein [Alphaproteobacteria bacterium]|nr:DUF4065 domain-containing protein [Alphaproteobacteria bacterium]
MSVPYMPLSVANYFIDRFGRDIGGLRHIKIQKLLYLSHGHWLIFEGLEAPPLMTVRPEVMKTGPRFRELYEFLKIFGHCPILEPQSRHPFAPEESLDSEDKKVQDFLSWIWCRYGHMSSFVLCEKQQSKGSAWFKIAAENDFRVPRGTEIPDQYVYEEFLGDSEQTGLLPPEITV